MDDWNVSLGVVCLCILQGVMCVQLWKPGLIVVFVVCFVGRAALTRKFLRLGGLLYATSGGSLNIFLHYGSLKLATFNIRT